MSKAKDFLNLIESQEDVPRAMLQQALTKEYNKVDDLLSNEFVGKVNKEAKSKKYADKLDAIIKLSKSDKVVKQAKESKEVIAKILKAKTREELRSM